MVHIMEGPGFHERAITRRATGTASSTIPPSAKIGVAICYDRHFPEYMRGLALLGAESWSFPRPAIRDEWGEGLYEGEVRIAAFQNGYFAALCNRVGREDVLDFAGESFVVDPAGTSWRVPRRAATISSSPSATCRSMRPATPSGISCRTAAPSLYRELKLTD